MNVLNLVACNSDGEMKFYYGEHTITTNAKRMFKWKSETLTREDKTIVKDVERQILDCKRIIEKGVKRAWKKN